MMMNPWTADFLANLAAELATTMLENAGRRVRDALSAPEAEQALRRSVKAGLVALLLTANPTDSGEAVLLDDIFRDFLRDPDVAHEFSRLLRGHSPEMEELRYLFTEVGYDAETLPAVSFEDAMRAFEAAFVEAAVQEPALQETISTAHAVVQTQVQRALLEQVRALIAFLGEHWTDRLGVHADVIIAQNVVSGEQHTYQMRQVDSEAPAAGWEPHYLRTLLSLCDPLDLAQIDETYVHRSSDGGVRISDVYTSLYLDKSYRRENETVAEALTGPREEMLESRRREVEELVPIQALEAIGSLTQLVILGRPGGGKSTLVNYCTAQLARRRLGQQMREMPGWEDDFQPLPVRIVLRRFAAWLPEETACGTAGHVWDYLEYELAQCGCREFFPALKRTLRDDGGLVFFDGLDEVSASDAACKRTAIKEAIVAFAQPLEKCQVVITCREYAYQDDDEWRLPESDFPVVELALFKLEQIHDFANTWYAVLGPQKGWDSERCRDEARNLYRAVESLPHLRELAQYPLLLTLMAQVHGRDGYLPQDRADLYERAVNLLLAHWENRIVRDERGGRKVEPSIIMRLGIRLETLRKALEEVAFRAHERQEQQSDREDQPADIPRDDLREALREALGSLDFAEQVIAYVQQRAGLLQALETATYAFPHRTFQEYLAASYLMRQAEFDTLLRERVHRDPTWWQEVFLLAAGASRQTPRLISDLVNGILVLYDGKASVKPERVAWARLAAQALAETRFVEQVEAEDVPGRYARTYRDVRQWLLVGMRADAVIKPQDRAAAGDRLAALGDPRFRADAWYLPDEPLLGFVKIPAGPFVMGTRVEEIPALLEQYGGQREWYEWEIPQHERELSTYYMARYPVTVAQFRAFVRDSEHELDSERSLEGIVTHPVVHVTWHDAMAYCRWLTERLWKWEGTPEPLATLLREERWAVTLPSEAQWEKAARGEDGRIYPWGNRADPNRANYGETGIGSTSAVGCFPGGVSPYEIEELNGNVVEWTRTGWQEDYRECQPDLEARDRAVVRGGAFGHDERDVRCAFRVWYYPVDRYGYFGFRVVCGAPIPRDSDASDL